MSYLCPHCNSFPLEDHVWWVLGGEGRNDWWCAICGERYDWKQPNRLLVMQTGERVNQAKVLKALQCGPLWKSDECAEVAGEPTRRWRGLHTEHRDKPR